MYPEPEFLRVPEPSKKIECVTVCVNYSDILAYTLPNNRTLFNNYIVVTDKKDSATKRLCQIYNVKCIETDVFYGGAKFDKGAGINEGLKHLDMDGYVVQLDADIWIHPQSFRQLKALTLNPQCIYGCDRIMIESFREWIRFLQMPDIYQGDWILMLDKFKVGSRLSYYWQNEMWHVLGYFQLWNPSGSDVYNYPSYDDASQSDIIFSRNWHRTRRVFLPEVAVLHLEEGSSMTGKNWQGRNNKNFGINEETNPV